MSAVVRMPGRVIGRLRAALERRVIEQRRRVDAADQRLAAIAGRGAVRRLSDFGVDVSDVGEGMLLRLHGADGEAVGQVVRMDSANMGVVELADGSGERAWFHVDNVMAILSGKWPEL